MLQAPNGSADQSLLRELVAEMRQLRATVERQEKKISELERAREAPRGGEFSRGGGLTIGAPIARTARESAPRPKPATSASFAPRKSSADLEWRFGIHYLSRIGMIAVLLGVSFFLKYSFDNNWIGPLGRVVIGFAGGFIILGVGEYFRRKYENWSRVFTGGGLAILYFSAYAAEFFYGFISIPVALLVMSAITILAGALAIYYRSFAVAIFALVGGYLTPLLVAEIGSIPNLLYPYLVLLGLAIAALSYARQWRILDIIAFLLTFTYGLAMAKSLPVQTEVAYLTAFYLIFSVSAWGQARIVKPTSFDPRFELSSVFLILLATAYFGGLWNILHGTDRILLGGWILVLGFLHAVLSEALRRKKDTVALFSDTHIALAVGFAAAGCAVLLDYHWVTILWAVFAAALVFVGTQSSRATLSACGVFVALAAWAHFVLFDRLQALGPNPTAIINAGFVSGFVVSLALLAVGWRYADSESGEEIKEKSLLAGFSGFLGSITLLWLAVQELNHFAPAAVSPHLITITVIIFSLPIAWASSRRRDVFGHIYALCVLAFGIVRYLIEHVSSISYGSPVANLTFLDGAALVLVLAILYTLYANRRDQIAKEMRDMYRAINVVLHGAILTLIVNEVIDFVVSRQVEQMIVSIILGLYAAMLVVYGIMRQSRVNRICGLVLFVLTIIKVIAVDLSGLETIYRVLAFIVVGVILIGASYAYQRSAKTEKT